MSVHDHHQHRPSRPLKAGVITVSDSRTADTDGSGKLIGDLLKHAGHELAYYEVMPDEPRQITAAVIAQRERLDVIVINGGTGIGLRDQTYEAVKGLLDKELDGFGELFRMLSYQEIGSAAFLSRAVAGISAGKILVSLPGSTAACRLGLEKLLLPELGHMAHLLGLV
jgi:molybdenum cofactor biosynthesis protein B